MDNNTIPNQYARHIDYIRLSVALLLLLIIAFTIIFAYTSNNKIRIDDIPTPVVKTIPFNNTQVLATSAIVWDTTKQKALYSKNIDEVLPLASLTKVVSALTATLNAPEYTTVGITGNDLMAEGDTGLFIGEQWTLKDLLNFTLVSSSNDGARAVANVISASHENVFIDSMNQTAQDIGLSNTRFYNENGLDIDTVKSGGYGSALDVAKLFDYIMKNKPELLEATRYSSVPVSSLTNGTRIIQNTNTGLPLTPGIMASKTGYTDLAGGNLAVVVDPGMSGPYVIVVLGSDYEGRFKDIELLSKDLLEYLDKSN